MGCMNPMSFTFILLVILALFSCKHTEIVTSDKVRTDTMYVNKWQHDSIHVHDSIYLHEHIKGDTVFIEKTSWHTHYKDRIVVDTAYISRTDTLTRTVTLTKAKPFTGWQWFQIWAGRLALIAIALTLIIVVVRYMYRRV